MQQSGKRHHPEYQRPLTVTPVPPRCFSQDANFANFVALQQGAIQKKRPTMRLALAGRHRKQLGPEAWLPESLGWRIHFRAVCSGFPSLSAHRNRDGAAALFF